MAADGAKNLNSPRHDDPSNGVYLLLQEQAATIKALKQENDELRKAVRKLGITISYLGRETIRLSSARQPRLGWLPPEPCA